MLASRDVVSLREQIGNVSILLEKGNETDHYPYLELYIEAWKNRTEDIKAACATRNMTTEHDEDSLEEVDDDAITENDGIIPPTNHSHVRRRAQPSKGPDPEWIETQSYQGPFDPYDFYAKTGTEVRPQYSTMNICGAACTHTIVSVLLALRGVHARTALFPRSPLACPEEHSQGITAAAWSAGVVVG